MILNILTGLWQTAMQWYYLGNENIFIAIIKHYHSWVGQLQVNRSILTEELWLVHELHFLYNIQGTAKT